MGSGGIDRGRERFRQSMLARQRAWTPTLAGGPLITFSSPPYDDTSEFDEFGMSRFGNIPEIEQYEVLRSRLPVVKKQREAWARLLGRHINKRRWSEIKKLLRLGVPNEFRAEVWSFVLGSIYDIERVGVYAQYVTAAIDQNTINQIQLDVNRTFPTNVLFRTSEGSSRLSRVLQAFAAYQSEINYCQSMNFLAGLLLIFMDEELAFWSLARLIGPSRRIESVQFSGLNIADYYESNMTGLRRDTKALHMLMKAWTPVSLARLDQCGVELGWICSEWFLCLFATSLPFRTVLRIWDSLLFEGTKVIFRVALSLMREFNRAAGISKNNVGLEWVMNYFKQTLQQNAYDHDILMYGAFKGFRNFSKKDIAKARALAMCTVKEEDEEREKLRAARAITPPLLIVTAATTEEPAKQNKSLEIVPGDVSDFPDDISSLSAIQVIETCSDFEQSSEPSQEIVDEETIISKESSSPDESSTPEKTVEKRQVSSELKLCSLDSLFPNSTSNYDAH